MVTTAPGLSVGWMREIVPLIAVEWVTMKDCPPSEYTAARMAQSGKSFWPSASTAAV